MRERGIPDGWAGRSVDPVTPLAAELELPQKVRRSPSKQPKPPGSGDNQNTPNPKRRWQKNWLFWAGLGALVSGGAGLISVALLLKLPAIPNCPSIFWPTASASMRLYCAQIAANKHTAEDLLQAIALVQALPPDHPLRPEINSYLEQWSIEILGLADEAFQAGKLDEAIAIARKIPQDVTAYKSVENRIASWQSIWSKAEGIYQEAEAEIRQQHWHQAFMIAVRLLNIDNNYWSKTKYDELNNSIETARQDANKLAKAQSLAKSGGTANLIAAIKLVESIGTNSYIYKAAQDALAGFGREMLDLAQQALDKKDADEAISIANQVPASTNLQAEAQDFVTLASARKSAWMDTVAGLQVAIETAKKIGSDRPLYNKAQELINGWQLETDDVAHLERAREFAQKGTVADLRAAIVEVQMIPDKNPRVQDRDQEIKRWRGQVETIEDRPYLDRAEQKASSGDIKALEAAINEASQISSGRALYPEAQSKIRTWTRKIQQIQDQPYLDRAEQLASSEDINSLLGAINEATHIGEGRSLYPEAQSKIRTWRRKIEQIQDQPYIDAAREQASVGNLTAAIATAQKIRSGRALFSEAQATIDDWQGQLRARENWNNARRLALQGTPEALRDAIRVAERVPDSSPWRSDVNSAIQQWSHQILSIAQDRGAYDMPGAIAIAKQIPSGSDAYNAAQQQIEAWQKFLNPVQTTNNNDQSNTVPN